jgi:hypothetical protein
LGRTEVLELMIRLKLYGKHAAYDEVMSAGISRRRSSMIRSPPTSPRSGRARSSIG